MALTYSSQSRHARPYLMSRPSASQVGSVSHSSSTSGSSNKPRRPEAAVMEIAKGLVKNAATRPQVLHVRNNDGDTFFHVACRSGYTQVVSYMLASAPPAALDLDEVSPGGFTPLAYAARGAFQEIVKQLVAAGADITLFERSDRARFLPPLPEHRNAILRAIESGRNEYVGRLSQRLMALDFEPWSRTPEVIINIVVDYVCAPPSDMPAPAKKKSVSKVSLADGEYKEEDGDEFESEPQLSLVESLEQSFASAAVSSTTATNNARPLDAD